MLSDTHRQVLDFEARNQHWRHGGTREAAVRAQFAWSLARHAQVLHALLEDPEALAYAPVTVRRLGRLAERRREARSSDRVK